MVRRGPASVFVEPTKAVHDGFGSFQFSPPKHGFALDIVTRDNEGFWTSAVTLVLDREADDFPKWGFQIFLRFFLKDRQCELTVDDWGISEKFCLNIDNPAGFEPVYEYMVQIVQKFLSTLLSPPPWSTTDRPKIGFVSL